MPPEKKAVFIKPVYAWFSLLATGLALVVFIHHSLCTEAACQSYLASVLGSVQPTAGWTAANEFYNTTGHARPQKVLEVGLRYQASAATPVTVEGVATRMSFPSTDKFDKGGYRMDLVDVNNIALVTANFSIPNEFDDPPPLPGDTVLNQSLILSDLDFAVVIPWHASGESILVYNPEGNLISTTAIKGAPHVDNQPNFRSIRGDRFQRANKASAAFIDSMTSTAAAASDNGMLDIVFIGEGYSSGQLSTFHTDVNRMINHILIYEPYKSRAAQINFYYVDNTSSLGCTYNGRLLTCNNNLVVTALAAAAVPYDKAVVIVNNSTYGGAGGVIAVSYNGTKGPQVFVHEFAHSFGGLVDEYNLYSTNGGTGDFVSANCYLGATPPATAWQNLVGLSDYTQGCKYPNWYRSSARSSMYDLSFYFNVISQQMLNTALNAYAGPFSDAQPPTASITSPNNGAQVTNTVSVSANLSDNYGVARGELWVDNQLQKTLYTTPYTFSWNTTGFTNGQHTVQVKAHDTAGNQTASTVTLSVQNGVTDTTPPTTSITAPTQGATVSGITLVTATASDNSGSVSRVELYRDGAFVGSDTSSPFEFSWSTQGSTNGSHTLTTKAFDAAGNNGTSAPVSVTVQNVIDSVTPTVLITNPTSGSVIARRTAVQIAATATDDIGVTKVEFLVGTSITCTDTSAPYVCAWTVPNSPNKTYQLKARAYDAGGNMGTSQTVTVTSK